MRLAIERSADVPIYRQIVHQVRDQIRSGELPVGYRLPPVRQLAAEHSLTRLTVHSAYSELQAQGLVESFVGRGTFVAPDVVRPLDGEAVSRPPPAWTSRGVLTELLSAGGRADLISFAQAFPDPGSFPSRELGRALQAAARDPGALGYGSIQGEEDLRQEIASLLLERGLSVSPELLLVTGGAQQGIDVALRACCRPEDVLLVEEPTYPGVLELASLRGQRVIGLPSDAQGMRVDALEMACAAHRPRLLYLVSTFNNPTGRSLPPERRAALLRVANRHGLTILEDDTYGFLGLDQRAPPSLKSDDSQERVIYILSFSKMLAPALRLGALVAPAALLPSLAAAKQSADLVCSVLLQRALAHYLHAGHLANHLHRVRGLYRERREVMLESLRQSLGDCTWIRPEGGLSLQLTLPAGVVERDLGRDAMQAGVAVTPGAAFYATPQPISSLRLSFGSEPPERIREGVATLGRVLGSHLQRRSELMTHPLGAASPLV